MKAIIFDLGNVLINCGDSGVFGYWSEKTGAAPDELRSRFSIDNEYKMFERNEISEDGYIKHLTKILKIKLSVDEFRNGWNNLIIGINEDTLRNISRLSGQCRIVALTNTNETHHSHWSNLYREELRYFEKVFCSHEIGYRKPEAAAFQHVLDYLDMEAGEVMFVDDIRENVIAAKSLGLKILHFNDNNMLNEI